MKIVIGVGREGKGREAAFGDVHSQFLVQLAHQGGLGRFVRFHLAAGKLP